MISEPLVNENSVAERFYFLWVDLLKDYVRWGFFPPPEKDEFGVWYWRESVLAEIEKKGLERQSKSQDEEPPISLFWRIRVSYRGRP